MHRRRGTVRLALDNVPFPLPAGSPSARGCFGNGDLSNLDEGSLVRRSVAGFLLPRADGDGGGVQGAERDAEVAGGGEAGVAGGHLDEANRRVPAQEPFGGVEVIERGGPVFGQDSGDDARVEPAAVGCGLRDALTAPAPE